MEMVHLKRCYIYTHSNKSLERLPLVTYTTQLAFIMHASLKCTSLSRCYIHFYTVNISIPL